MKDDCNQTRFYSKFILLTILQHLYSARQHEIETEDHLFKIAEREEGRLTQEIMKLERELEEMKEKKNVFEVCYSVIMVPDI